MAASMKKTETFLATVERLLKAKDFAVTILRTDAGGADILAGPVGTAATLLRVDFPPEHYFAVTERGSLVSPHDVANIFRLRAARTRHPRLRVRVLVPT